MSIIIIQHLVKTYQKTTHTEKITLLFKFNVTMTTKHRTISGFTLQSNFLPSTRVHISNKYKFKFNLILPTNANETWFQIFITMAIQMRDGQLPYIKQLVKIYYLSLANAYMSNTYKLLLRKICFFTNQN